MPPKQIRAQLNESLVELLAAKARANGALWQGHASLFMDQTMSIVQLIDSSQFTGPMAVPVAYPSVRDLLFAADCGGYEVTPVGSEAHRLRGRSGTCNFGVDQLWVRAGYKAYRKCMLELWGGEFHSASPEDHQAAAKVFDECIDGVSQGTVRKKLAQVNRALLISELEKHRDAHARAAAQHRSDSELMKDFDCTIDADHVFAKSAIHEDAYVWIFPVPANANRGYGRLVERYYAKRKMVEVDDGRREQSSATEYLSPGMTFKLLSGAMPITADGVDGIRDHVLARLTDTCPQIRWWRDEITAFSAWLKDELGSSRSASGIVQP